MLEKFYRGARVRDKVKGEKIINRLERIEVGVSVRSIQRWWNKWEEEGLGSRESKRKPCIRKIIGLNQYFPQN